MKTEMLIQPRPISGGDRRDLCECLKRGVLRSIATLCFLWGLVPFANAECQAPAAPASIPSGKTATAPEMAAAKEQMLAFDKATGNYRNCMLGEMGQRAIGHTPEETSAIRAEIANAYDQVWAQVVGMSDCLNAELRSFKETGGGKKAEPADCSAYMEKARQADAAPANPVRKNDAGFSEPQVLPTGSWRYRIVLGEQPVQCVAQGEVNCVPVSIEVENASGEILECQAQLDLQGVDQEGRSHVENPGVVPAGTNRAVLRTYLLPGATVTLGASACRPRMPYPPLENPPNCRFQVVRSVSLGDYYPATSRRIGEEGPVATQFTLKKAEGKPSDIQVIGSSLFSRLDAAAMKAIGNMVMTTPCPGLQFRIQVTFKLD